MPSERAAKSIPIPIHRSASYSPSMMVNSKKYLSDRPQLLDCPRCKDVEHRCENCRFDMTTNGSHSPPPPYADVNPPHYGNSESKVPPNLAGGFPPSPQFGSGTSGVAQYLTNPSLAPGAPPPPTQPATTRIVISARTALFGPFPVEMDCPYCHNHIVTHTSRVPGILPWIILAVCFVLGFFLLVPWCLCCLPFCVDACLDVLHSCPSCKRLVGRFSRL